MSSQTIKSAGVVRRPARRRGPSSRTEPYLLVLPAIAVLALFFAGPAVYNIALSFQRISLFELGKGGEWVGLQNFVELAGEPATYRAFVNTAFWQTFVTVLVRLLLGLAIAMLLNTSVFKRWGIVWLTRSLILIPWVTPPVVAVAAWKWLLDPRYGVVNQLMVQFGWIDNGIPFLARTSTVWGAVETMIVWRELPFMIVAFLAALQAIPSELKEAARVDGASEWRITLSIVLPLMRPVIAVVAMLTTIWTFNNFVYVWLATGGGPGNYTQVLATQMYSTSFVDYRIGAGAAIGVVMSLIMFVFALFYFLFVFRER
ncbi:carbohydrate ABC transporter permease [Consotaella aegiceratis]|uniref:carbohydrate ABC transporter permease n=1 Tax=Consotaella aegiceratis TaxID=3097961 RepID=UPI002F40EC12